MTRNQDLPESGREESEPENLEACVAYLIVKRRTEFLRRIMIAELNELCQACPNNTSPPVPPVDGEKH